MGKYFEFVLFEYKYALRYRVNTVFSAVSDVLSFLVIFFLWKTIFALQGTGWGYSFNQMATYYLIVTFLQTNTPVCWNEFSFYKKREHGEFSCTSSQHLFALLF